MPSDHAELMSPETEDIESHEVGHESVQTSAWSIKNRWKIIAGVFAAVAFGGIASRGNWTSRTASTSSLEASIDLVADEDKWKSITCPVMGALFKAGDLQPDSRGFVTAGACFTSMANVGISTAVAHATTAGNFAHLRPGDSFDLFNMDVHDLSTRSKNIEHDKSTGIRDGKEPNEAHYDEFEQFIGHDEVWRIENVEEAIEHYEENWHDRGSGAEGGLKSIKAMFEEFKNSDNTLSKEEMKGLYLNSDYPNEFNERREERLSE